MSKDVFNRRDPFNDDDFFDGFFKGFAKTAVVVVLLNLAFYTAIIGVIAWFIWLLFL